MNNGCLVLENSCTVSVIIFKLQTQINDSKILMTSLQNIFNKNGRGTFQPYLKSKALKTFTLGPKVNQLCEARKNEQEKKIQKKNIPTPFFDAYI